MKSAADPLKKLVGYSEKFKESLFVLMVAIAYFLCHQISFLFPDSGKVLSAVWPAGGIALAALLIAPKRLWMTILISFFIAGNIANLLTGRPLINSLGFMTANIIESFSCAFFITYVCGTKVRFTRIRDVLSLIFASIFINALSALIGAETASLTSKSPFWESWLTWWIADGLGILLVTPLIISFLNFRIQITRKEIIKTIEFIVFLVIWTVFSWLMFNQNVLTRFITPQPYMLFALLIWPALRFRQREITITLLLLAAIMISSTVVSIGPLIWGGQDASARLLLVQAFIAIISITGFILSTSFEETRQAEESARLNEERFRSITCSTPDHIIMQDLDLRYNFVINPQLGLTENDMIGKTDFDFLPQKDAENLTKIKKRVLQTGIPVSLEVPLSSTDGIQEFFSGSYIPEYNSEGRVNGLIGYFRNTTEQKLANEILQKTISEKETLLKELYHRTKNNMQVICALLEMQSAQLKDENLRNILKDTQNRIYSMALVHQKLYEAKNLSHINLKEYITDLTFLLVRSYTVIPGKVEINLELDDLYVLVDSAIPCGLIINEQISNALKYAFPGNKTGTISIFLRSKENKEIELIISDNGIGLPDGFEPKKDGHLGMKNTFAVGEKQLKGKINYTTENGVRFELVFKDNLYKTRI